jgi:nitrogen fixation-related uncharacterized protein
MTPIYIAIYGFTVIFGATAIVALVWAIRRGQMESFRKNARSIFDSGEPIGRATDAFPGAKR